MKKHAVKPRKGFDTRNKTEANAYLHLTLLPNLKFVPVLVLCIKPRALSDTNTDRL